MARPWIDVRGLKAELNKLSDVDDAELQRFIRAACTAIVRRVGEVVPDNFTEDCTASPGGTIVPLHRPLMSVNDVTLLGPGQQSTSVDKYEVEYGVLLVPFTGRYRISYTAGLAQIPDDYKLAALILAGHLWTTTQMRGGSVGKGTAVDPEMVIAPGHAMPVAVEELLGLGSPTHTSVFVA